MRTESSAERTDAAPAVPDLSPDAFADPAHEGRLRALPAEARAALLAEADRLAGMGAQERATAFRTYCALEPFLRADDADGRRRLCWVVENLAFIHAAMVPLCRRALPLLEGEARAKCVMYLARALEITGEPAEAQSFIADEYRLHRGAGTRSEALIAFAASRIAVAQEDHARVLAFTRRTAAVARDTGQVDLVALSALARASTFDGMGDIPRAWSALGEAEAAIAGADEASRPILRFQADAARAAGLLAEKRFREAFETLGRVDISSPRVRNPMVERGMSVLLARAAVGLGRHAEARAHLARAEAVAAVHVMQTFTIGRARMELALALGDADAANAEVVRMLDCLDGDARKSFQPQARFRYANEAAIAAADEGLDAAVALRACDLAAEALHDALRRMPEEVAAVPEIGVLHPDDTRVLMDHRTRLRESHEGTLRRIQSLLMARLSRGGPGLPDLLARSKAEVTVCAWCCRMQDAGGTWLPVAQFFPDDIHPAISHGICEDCCRRLG